MSSSVSEPSFWCAPLHPASASSPMESACSDPGESKHVAVAAASILAKVHRDELFARIVARYEPHFGPIRGGGYVNARTRAFTDAYRARFGTLPPEARTSWPWPAVAKATQEDN